MNGLISAIIVLMVMNLPMVSAQKNKSDKSFNSSKAPLKVFAGNEVTLTSPWLKQREALNQKYLYSLDPDRLLHNFRVNAGITSYALHLEGWEAPQIGLRGHFVGHYLSACAALIEKNKDPLLIKRINYMVDALGEC